MSGEPPTKRRKTKNKELPNISIEVAEPAPAPEEDVPGPRQRQCNLSEMPFEFLTPAEKAEVEHAIKLEEQAIAEKLEKENEDSKKAKTLLGVFIGAGIGMWFAYILRDKLFSKTVVKAVESASDIIDK